MYIIINIRLKSAMDLFDISAKYKQTPILKGVSICRFTLHFSKIDPAVPERS